VTKTPKIITETEAVFTVSIFLTNLSMVAGLGTIVRAMYAAIDGNNEFRTFWTADLCRMVWRNRKCRLN
jgi:hypothetical protein